MPLTKTTTKTEETLDSSDEEKGSGKLPIKQRKTQNLKSKEKM